MVENDKVMHHRDDFTIRVKEMQQASTYFRVPT